MCVISDLNSEVPFRAGKILLCFQKKFCLWGFSTENRKQCQVIAATPTEQLSEMEGRKNEGVARFSYIYEKECFRGCLVHVCIGSGRMFGITFSLLKSY